MQPLNLNAVQDYVNTHIVDFHQARLRSLTGLKLRQLLRRKNPYLFRAKHITTAAELVESLLGAYLSSSEEKHFGDFLEGLAIFIAEQTCNGHKSAAPGVDLEFIHADTHYIVSIKSGPNWGNSSQQKRLAQDLHEAVRRVRQARTQLHVEPVLGICYGRQATTYTKAGYLRVVGQNFWYFISENPHLYTDIIEPLGYRAREHNEQFLAERAKIVNRFTQELITGFCTPDGAIDWVALVAFNSGNLDLSGLQAQ